MASKKAKQNECGVHVDKVEKHVKNIKPTADVVKYPASEIGMAKLFADTHSKVAKYVQQLRKWVCYTGAQWLVDSTDSAVFQLAERFVEQLRTSCDDENYAELFQKKLSTVSSIRALLSGAKMYATIDIEKFDSDPYLLNCKNCTIDLRSNKCREHNPDDFLMKMANVEFKEDATCERWLTFISEIMCGDADLAGYLQKAFGYALSGDVSLECFFILYGAKTRNGKGTLAETVKFLMGDYAVALQPRSLSKRNGDGNSPSADIAKLAGRRLVSVSEPESGLKLNGAQMKQMTGGDTVTARKLFQDFFEYKPQYKVFVNTNYLFEIDDVTLFTSNRVIVIPFDRQFNEEEQQRG